MKLVYMCRTLFKKWGGGLREQPLTENAGGCFQNGPSREKWHLGVKNNKETYILIKLRSFRSAQVGKAEQRIVYFEKGIFWSGPGRNSRVAKSEKWGLSRGTYPYSP